FCGGHPHPVPFTRWPGEPPPLELLVHEREPTVGPQQRLERVAATVGEQEQRPVQRLFTELALAHRRESIDLLAEVHGSSGEHDPLWHGDHDSASTTCRSSLRSVCRSTST